MISQMSRHPGRGHEPPTSHLERRCIYKFELELGALCVLELATSSRVLHFAEQDEKLMVWVEVGGPGPIEARSLRVVGTGHPWDPRHYEYRGTCQQGRYVWHLLEGRKEG